jgi:hypothetical protein
MRALERLRGVETAIAVRAETLRGWLRADLEAARSAAGIAAPVPPTGRAERGDLWWRDPLPGPPPRADRTTLDRIPVLAEWLASVDAALGRRYEPGRGDGSPLASILDPLFRDLDEAMRLRARAGIRA